MKIAIDLTSLSYHLSGIERYALCITSSLLQEDTENTYILIFRDKVYHEFENKIDNIRIYAKVLKGNNKLIFNQIILPYNLYKIKADKYLFLAFANPILFRKEGIISILHDMGAFDFSQNDSIVKKIYFRTGCFAAALNSEELLTVSCFSKDRICKLLKVPEEKVHVVYSATAESLSHSNADYQIVKDKYHLPNKYIMTLSTLEPRKNLELLLRAFTAIQDKVDYDLVLVGRKGWKMDGVLEKYNSKERIRITGFVEDEHVSLIYKNTTCFVFPTLYEGFGLPPVEALAMGTPVISSDAASMPEILRKQAVFFESNNQKELEELLLHLDDTVDTMPHELDEYQKKNYRFDASAKKILKILEQG